MEKFYTNKARQSKIEQITRLIEIVATVPGNVIGYTDARAITDILANYREDLEKECSGVCE